VIPQQQGPGFQDQFNRVGNALDRLAMRMHGTHGRLGELTDRLTVAEEQIRILTEAVSALDRRFTEVLNSTYQRDNPDALDSSYLDHQNLAHSVEDLLSDVWQTVRVTLKHTSPTVRAEAMAYVAHALWERLSPEKLEEVPPQIADCVHTCVETFRPRAEQIADQAATLTAAEVFDFTHTSHRIDPQRQDAWADCDPADEVAFVVTPGYAVGTRVLLLQRVFTRLPSA
jgi:hypothetical protein